MQVMPEFGFGGAEIMAENLSAMLVKEGIEVCVVSLYDYHSVITERLKKNNIPVYFLGKRKGFDPKIFFRLFNLMRKEKPQVVHAHLYSAVYVFPAALCALVRLKVHTLHNVAGKEFSKLYRKLCAFFYRYCGVIPISISPIVKRTVMDVYRLSDEKVPMIYNGIDLDRCIPKKEYKSKKSSVILHVGRFVEQKNHSFLIDSFSIVHSKSPDTVLKLIGEGILENLIREKIKQAGLDDAVELLGVKPDVYPYLNDADLFILPSLWEGMPITLIEAMATGLPIVATKAGGIPDMITDGVTGVLVEVDKNIVADALLDLIYDPEKRQKLGTAAKMASARFSSEKMATEYIKVYRKLLNMR